MFARVVGTAAAALIAVTVVAAGAPAAFAAPRAQTEHFSISYASDRDIVLAHGPVVGSGKVAVHARKDVLHLGHGTLTMFFDPSELTYTGGVATKSCFFHFKTRIPYTLGHGTGRYRGVTGHGVMHGREQALGHLKKDGSCRNDHFYDEVAFFKASGPITVPA